MPPPAVIFDFDGTLADTFSKGILILNELAREFGFRQIETDAIPGLKNFTSMELIQYLGIPLLQVPLVMNRARKELYREIDQIEAFSGWKDVLGQLKDAGSLLGIVTSNSPDNVEAFLKRQRLEYFDFVYSMTGLWGKKKRLEKALKGQKLKPSQTVYVGDEVRDIEAAKKVGIPMIAVTWGFNTPKALQAYHPEHLIETPLQLLEVLAQRFP